ncbi:MAG: beta-lactamase family protein [Chloroflexi bacterium]|nr:beta-lactamase family protein [Chloroflexota bacterium]
MSDATATIQRLIDQLVADGTEVGLQVAAHVDGRRVLDVWAGTADDVTGRPVDADTLFTVFSATKALLATSIHILAERGKVDYDAPVATYWPAFGAHGKQSVTVRQALSHQAGIPQLPAHVTPAMRCDWDTMCAVVADLALEWAPGTRTEYHGLTFGWILGEVLRRVDGRDARAFVHEEIAAPLDAPDLHIGVTPAQETRAARLRNPAGEPATPPADEWNHSATRQAIIPAAGGLVSARSLARHYALLAGGGQFEGVRLLSPERVAAAHVPQTAARDAAAIGMVFGLGYRVGATIYGEGSLLSALGRTPAVFGHTGAGGALGFADANHGFAFALTKNLLYPGGPDRRSSTATIVRAVRDALGVPFAPDA